MGTAVRKQDRKAICFLIVGIVMSECIPAKEQLTEK